MAANPLLVAFPLKSRPRGHGRPTGPRRDGWPSQTRRTLHPRMLLACGGRSMATLVPGVSLQATIQTRAAEGPKMMRE